MRRRPVLVLAVLGLTGLAGGCGIIGGSASSAPTTVPPGQVRTVSLPLVDRSRPTPANGSVPASPERALPTTVWLPPGQGRVPLVVWGHGFDGDMATYEQFTRTLASAGFLVAAPRFPLTHKGTPGGPQFADYVHQPADVRFVIDALLAASDDPASPLHRRIDANHIAVGGHSLGAVTALAAAFDGCCADGRIDAVIAASGLELPFPGGVYNVGGGTPVLFLHGTKDNIVPFDNGALAYKHRVPPKWFVTLKGAGHDVFRPARYREVVERVATDFLDGTLHGHRGSLERIGRDGKRGGAGTVDAAPS